MGLADDLDGAVLLDSATRATHWGGLLFVPAALWTPDGWSDGVRRRPLDAYTAAFLPTGVQPDGCSVLEDHNALWVRARLPVAIGFAPPTCRHAVRWRFLDAALLAVSVGEGEPRGTPFVCTDRLLKAEVRFGCACPAHRAPGGGGGVLGAACIGSGGPGELPRPIHV